MRKIVSFEKKIIAIRFTYYFFLGMVPKPQGKMEKTGKSWSYWSSLQPLSEPQYNRTSSIRSTPNAAQSIQPSVWTTKAFRYFSIQVSSSRPSWIPTLSSILSQRCTSVSTTLSRFIPFYQFFSNIVGKYFGSSKTETGVYGISTTITRIDNSHRNTT